MTVLFDPRDLARPARRRRAVDDALTGLPLALTAAALAWRVAGPFAAVAITVAAIAVVAAVIAARMRHFDQAWLIRRLDRGAETNDSADLLFADDAALTPLARLQRDRVARRLADAAPDLRPRWSGRRMAAALGLAAVVVAAMFALPAPPPLAALAPSREGLPARAGVPRLTGQRLRITPPAYTGLPPRDLAVLDARAPVGSRLDWTLTFAPQPGAAALVLADGSLTSLVRDGARWTARRTLDRPVLYRIMPQGGATPPLHRLDAIADAPPQVRVVAPATPLSRVTPGQRRWPLLFEARDDYGVAPVAQLHLTIAEGDGENVASREVVVAVRGTGGPRSVRFAAAADLTALHFAAGSDLIVRLEVHDNRPTPQTARSPSVILRWPAATSGADGMGGVVNRAMPAYFRSERQIIIDAEALIKARPRLSPADFLARSDTIAADQRLLRLRYGQFLGEEQEGANAAPTADAAPALAEGDGAVVTPAFGSEGGTLADYGHVHDESEAATLVDPATRALLKAALDAMWQAELNLHQAKPAAALPFANTALGLIKRVQQATRIFLARVGPDLPQVDLARRLTGKRDGLSDRDLPDAAATPPDPAAAAAWVALAQPAGATRVQLAALDRWLAANPVADPLAVAAALDAVRRDSTSDGARRVLRGQLWRGLPRPAPGVVRRDGGDASGRRYLDALRGAP